MHKEIISDKVGIGEVISMLNLIDTVVIYFIGFVLDVARKTGIILDPIYTGKAAMKMLDEMRTNPTRFKGRRILFIHTGTIQRFPFNACSTVLLCVPRMLI